METILFLGHTDADHRVPRAGLEALNAAFQLAKALGGAALSVGLFGEQVQSAADSIGGCGASGFLGVEGTEFGVSRYSSDAAAAEAIIRKSGATLVVAPGTSRMARTLPGVAQRVGGRIDTHVAEMLPSAEGPKIRRWYYRQRMAATLTRTDRPWILLVDSGTFESWQGEGGAGLATVEMLRVDLPASRTQVLGTEAASTDAQTIRPDAELLFVAGAGWTKKQADGQPHVREAESLIRGFLAKAQASLGSSKSLVDQSSEGQEVLTIMSHLNQVGQTGSSPRHLKGIATCCHGEEPHVVGWRFVKERRAVNLDPACGWARGKADVLYVADAFAVMEKINELLS